MSWFTKQRKKNFSCSSNFQGRFRPFSAVSRLFQPYRSLVDTIQYGRYDLILAKLARFNVNQAASMQIQEKKKKLKRGTDARATTSDAVSRVGPCRTQVQHPPSRVRAF